jgi:hypothetical protein
MSVFELGYGEENLDIMLVVIAPHWAAHGRRAKEKRNVQEHLVYVLRMARGHICGQ